MLSESALAALRDIAYHVDLAEHFAGGLDFIGFRDDLRTVYAVTRCLEIISEASRRLPDEMKARHPSIAWKNMAGAGNIYRHDYEDVAASRVWEAVKLDLPPLRVVIGQELAATGQPMKYGCACVSTDGQSVAAQVEASGLEMDLGEAGGQ